MYDYIKGTLKRTSPISVTVEASGIGYLVHIPASLFGNLPSLGSEVLLYVTLVVREDSHTLYGFLSLEERNLFEKVTAVSGIGPKIGMSLIGHLTIEKLQSAIHQNDIEAITCVPGIGKKIAQRLIMELQDKFAKLPAQFAIKTNSKTEKIVDAMNALIHLGYNQQIAQKAIKKTLDSHPESIDLPTLITQSLKNI